MILTCPECATRFLIKDEALGANGRTVRCSQCAATWFASPDPEILSLNENMRDTEIEMEPVAPSSVQASVQIPEPNPAENSVSTLDEDVGYNATPNTTAPHIQMRNQKDEKKWRRRVLGVSMIWIVTLALLGLFAAAAYLFRADIVSRFPVTKPLYNAFGIQANANGLEILDIETFRGENEGVPVLLVSGTVKNLDIRTRPVGLIEFTFRNQNDEALAAWVVEPIQSMLDTGAVLKFSTQYPNPPIDAIKLTPSFVDEMPSDISVPMVAGAMQTTN